VTAVEELLRGLPYFAEATRPALQGLAGRAETRRFQAGEPIFFEGEPSAGLWIIERGRVKAYKLSPEGQEFIMRFFGPGDTFNDLAAFDGAPNPTSTTALTEVAAWVIPTTVFGAALQADPDLARAVLRGLAGRVRHLVGQVEDLALRPATARLARFLLEQAGDPTLAHPAVTRALIANHLATTAETVSRSLRVLEAEGAIRFDRHRILIIDPEKLGELALL